MTTKEKLDMLWKYLALAVVAAGLILFSNMHLEDDDEHIFIGAHDGDHTSASFGKTMDVRVEKEVTDGDTILNVTVNGKPVDASNFEETGEGIKWVTEEGEVHVITTGHGKFEGGFGEMEIWIDEDNEDGKKQKKVIINKMKKKKH
ncbi:MAG TPA: hypothetical protein EYN68_00670 [Candidatus Marinimicrobia bacterium]|jgi:hypothetical protein|nr:hypothetical protein [Candidatus Neomarinimicrobiota bacterium]HHZ98083.1 hypothetical protein [Candidatus Neomarinimicrobiota bacterium]HIN62568.1 hypothetical protein [Candidatus Neomarinimicrobiota bacterium]